MTDRLPYSLVGGAFGALAGAAAGLFMAVLPALLVMYSPAAVMGVLLFMGGAGGLWGSAIGCRDDHPQWAKRVAVTVAVLTAICLAARLTLGP